MEPTMRIAALLAASALLAAPVWAAEQTMTGIIAYADCAEDKKVTPSEHAKCAEGKERDDMLLVFVPENDAKKIFELLFEEPADPYVGKMVTVQGDFEDNFLEIHKIEPKS